MISNSFRSHGSTAQKSQDEHGRNAMDKGATVSRISRETLIFHSGIMTRLKTPEPPQRLCSAHAAATNTDIEGWLRQVGHPIFQSITGSSPSSTLSTKRERNVDGALYGETIVFTGELAIPRQEAADRAVEAGCEVVRSVSRKVTMLVVGAQDKSKLNGYEKSSNHRKAENLIEQGLNIQILSECDFSELTRV